jgi:hypothetical protein
MIGGGEKQLPRCVPRPPNDGAKEKAQDSVRREITLRR